MNDPKLTDEQIALLNKMIKYGLNDDKRLKVLGEIVEASIAYGWFKKALIQIGVVSGAIGAIAGLYHIVKSLTGG